LLFYKRHNGEIEEFAEDVWIVEGPNVRDLGVGFMTRMVVTRLSDGSLFVDSPVSVSFDTLKRVTALESVKYHVAATPRHV